jgi:hypothetical protein
MASHLALTGKRFKSGLTGIRGDTGGLATDDMSFGDVTSFVIVMVLILMHRSPS